MDTKFYQQLCEEENILVAEIEEKTETLKAVRVLKARYKKNEVQFVQPIQDVKPLHKAGRPKLKLNFPLDYDSGLNQFQKTYIALHQLGKGFSTDIAKKLHDIAPKEFDTDKAYKVAREKASDLYQQGVFGIEKFGRKYKYFIK